MNFGRLVCLILCLHCVLRVGLISFVVAEAILEVLHILTGLAPALDTHSFNKCLPALAPLLATVSVHGVRVTICQTLQEIGHVDESLRSVVCFVICLTALVLNISFLRSLWL